MRILIRWTGIRIIQNIGGVWRRAGKMERLRIEFASAMIAVTDEPFGCEHKTLTENSLA
jgi:hypothetical protein